MYSIVAGKTHIYQSKEKERETTSLARSSMAALQKSHLSSSCNNNIAMNLPPSQHHSRKMRPRSILRRSADPIKAPKKTCPSPEEEQQSFATSATTTSSWSLFSQRSRRHSSQSSCGRPFLARTHSASDLIREKAIRRESSGIAEAESPGDSSEEEGQNEQERRSTSFRPSYSAPSMLIRQSLATRSSITESSPNTSDKQRSIMQLAPPVSSANSHGDRELQAISNNHAVLPCKHSHQKHHSHHHTRSRATIMRSQLFYSSASVNSGASSRASSHASSSSTRLRGNSKDARAVRFRDTPIQIEDSSNASSDTAFSRRRHNSASSHADSSLSSKRGSVSDNLSNGSFQLPKEQSQHFSGEGDSDYPSTHRSLMTGSQNDEASAASSQQGISRDSLKVVAERQDEWVGNRSVDKILHGLVCEEPQDEESVILSVMDCDSSSYSYGAQQQANRCRSYSYSRQSAHSTPLSYKEISTASTPPIYSPIIMEGLVATSKFIVGNNRMGLTYLASPLTQNLPPPLHQVRSQGWSYDGKKQYFDGMSETPVFYQAAQPASWDIPIHRTSS